MTRKYDPTKPEVISARVGAYIERGFELLQQGDDSYEAFPVEESSLEEDMIHERVKYREETKYNTPRRGGLTL